MGRYRQASGWLLASAVSLLAPAVAHGYTTASGYLAGDYATGLPEAPSNQWGPIGIAFDQSDNLYVADTADGNLYRFGPGGGVASAATRLTGSPIRGKLTGLVVSPTGALYLARYSPGDVLQIDPGTGRVIRIVADVPCATGLAIDPVSGDLFVSQNQCGSTIYRVSGFQSGPATATSYAQAPGVDGLAFDRDGTLYAESDGTVIQIAGTGSQSPGAVTDLAQVPHGDGLAFGAHAPGHPPTVFANRNDGRVTMVDFSQGFPREADVFRGGSRGDFAAVNSRGCLFITQSASIVRIAGPGHQCAFEPSTLGAVPGPAVVISTLALRAGRGCVARRRLVLRLRQRGRVRVRSVAVYVDGRMIRRLRGRAVTAPIVLRDLPSSAFTVRVVARTTGRRRLVTRRRFSANCARRGRRAARG